MEEREVFEFDVIVVGAGPSGCVAAWTASREGAKVLILEKKQEIGSPVRCAEGVPVSVLEELGISRTEKYLTHELREGKVYSPDGSMLIVKKNSIRL